MCGILRLKFIQRLYMQSDILFSDLSLKPELQKALSKLNYTHPTEIQLKSVPLLTSRACDFVGKAQTGTGKTAAFALPCLHQLNMDQDSPQALILAPTRELAQQIATEMNKFSEFMKVRYCVLVGGEGYRHQIQNLKSKKPQIVIGTPGRVIDMHNKGFLDVSEINNFILDEADEMLSMGFWDDVEFLIENANPNKQMWMFSATLPKPIKNLIDKSFQDPQFVEIDSKQVSNKNIDQSYVLIKDKYKVNALERILSTIDDFYGIIFCNTKLDTKNIGLKLMDKNYNVSVLHGDLAQSERESALRAFKKKQTRVLVCTDVASRGIDIDSISHVINFGLPRDKEAYIHRIGRTGRAGKDGTAVSILDRTDFDRLQKIERLLKQRIEKRAMPSNEQMKRRVLDVKMERVEKIKHNYLGFPESFSVDSLYEDFETSFKDLSKEESLKVIFSELFRNDLRRIDEQEDIELNMERSNDRGGRDRGRTRGRRGGSGRDERRGGGRRASSSGRGRSRDGERSFRKESRDSYRDGERSGRKRDRAGSRDEARDASGGRGRKRVNVNSKRSGGPKSSSESSYMDVRNKRKRKFSSKEKNY